MAAVKAVHPSAAQLFPAPSVGQALQTMALPQALAASWCYQQQLKHRLATVIASVGAFVGTNVCMLQVWFDAQEPATRDGRLLAADPQLALLCDPTFAEFRQRSCRTHLPDTHGMPGRVWHSGCCTVVQNIHIIPPSLHPRSRLADLQARRVAEIVYVPVYDPSGSHPYAPVAVLEAFCAADATDSMLVANLISFIGSLLTSVQLSLSSPMPQPVVRSSLAGRRSKPPADEQEQAPQQMAKQPPQPAQQQRPAQQPAQHPHRPQQPEAWQHPSLPQTQQPASQAQSAATAQPGPCSGVKRPSDGAAGGSDEGSRPTKRLARNFSMQRTKSVYDLRAPALTTAPTKPTQSC